MSQGISIHIGLNHVDPSAYGGWDGELAGCINDANDMNAIARSMGYSTTVLTDAQATASRVSQAIGQAARALVDGDMCLVTYSGHGGQITDVTADEADGKDETWVLWDRQLLDDELNGLWSSFASGVRVFVLSDSCHSGTVLRQLSFQKKFRNTEFALQYERAANDAPRVRAADEAALRANYEAHRTHYQVSQWTHRAAVNASVLLISGCQDNQLSADGDANGLFTQRLKEVWNEGGFVGNHGQFHSSIVARMPSDQTPNFYRAGVTNAAFEAQRPFVIDRSGSGVGTGGVLSITAPASVANDSSPLTFTITTPTGHFFAVEVATDASLFNAAANGAQRQPNNFFASWSVRPYLQGGSYTLPADVWGRLRGGASRLYYRVWSTASATAWVSHQVSVSDAAALSAPSVELVVAPLPGGVQGTPRITAPDSLPASGGVPRFLVDAGAAGRCYAVEITTNPWYFTPTYSPQRNDDNFYGSWRVMPLPGSALYPVAFEPPADVWARLKSRTTNARLYYRMWWSDAPTQWVNAGCTVPDATGQLAPSILLV